MLRLRPADSGAPCRWQCEGVLESDMGALCPQEWTFRFRSKDVLLSEAETLCTYHRDIYDMCAAMITRLATFASLTALVLASPIPDNSDIIGCINSWDSWGIACPNLGHHLFCDNLPGVRAGS